MDSQLILQVYCQESETAQLIDQATNPDNIELPKTMKMETATQNNIYSAKISFTGSLLTLRSTVDDLLQHIALSLTITEPD